jgi:hypothetical protein
MEEHSGPFLLVMAAAGVLLLTVILALLGKGLKDVRGWGGAPRDATKPMAEHERDKLWEKGGDALRDLDEWGRKKP